MAKTKKTQKKAPAKKSRRRRKNPAARAASAVGKAMNPPIGTDLAQQVVPAVIAFAAAKFIARVAATQVSKKWPKLGKHAGVIGSAISFAGAYFGAHRFDKTKEYHDQILIGAGINLVQVMLQTYVPKYGWVVSDYQRDMPTQNALPAAPTDTSGYELPTGAARNYALPGQVNSDDDLADLDDMDLGVLSYNGDEADLMFDDME